MAEVQEYKCPCCGGAIEFNSKLQKLKCPYCDTEFEIETLENYEKEMSGNDEMNWDTSSMQTWDAEDGEMKVFACKSCGGEIIVDENTAATACPFCDNPIVLSGNVEGGLKPEYIIPFKLDKKAAKQKFKEHLTGKKLLPKVFKDENHIEEIKGIYVPYWIFDSEVNARMRYKGTKVRHWSDSKYNYTETSHYSIVRGGNISFAHVPVDGSSKLADDLMESIEPFDFKDAVPFQKAYFAGFLADKYDVDENAGAVRVNERMKNSTADYFRQTVKGFGSVVTEGGNIQLSSGKANYVMYPVWILTTKWKDQLYTFAMNGQTGKFVGNLPEDKSLTGKLFAGITCALTIVIFLIRLLAWFII